MRSSVHVSLSVDACVEMRVHRAAGCCAISWCSKSIRTALITGIRLTIRNPADAADAVRDVTKYGVDEDSQSRIPVVGHVPNDDTWNPTRRRRRIEDDRLFPTWLRRVCDRRRLSSRPSVIVSWQAHQTALKAAAVTQEVMHTKIKRKKERKSCGYTTSQNLTKNLAKINN